jgi:hypothetical protein
VALGAILVDRGRLIEQVVSPQKVDGSSLTSTVRGRWFRCRLEMVEARERSGPGGGPPRAAPTPSLIYRPRDIEGLDMTKAVEIDSAQYGAAVWRVVGDPKPWRKKRKVIGYRATLMRVEEHQFTPPRG